MNEEEIKRAYVTPGHPLAFASPKIIHKALKGRIPYSKIYKILSHLDAYTLHKQTRRPLTNTYYILRPHELYQMDLVEVRKISKENDGVNYLLCIIEVFSRKLFVYALVNKKGETVEKALIEWLSKRNLPKRKILCGVDMGNEFLNIRVKTLLKNHNITLYVDHGNHKGAYIERAQKTLQKMIFQYLSHFEKMRYVDVLQDIVSTYNNRGHKSLNYNSPNFAEKKENEDFIRGIHMFRYSKKAMKRRKPKYKIGQMVRIRTLATKPSSSSRSYAESFHGEFYTIDKVNSRMAIPMYILKSMNTGEIIPQGFYEGELQVVRGDVWKVEKILKTRYKNKKKQYFIKWLHFDKSHSTWEDAKNIVNTF